MENQVSYLQSEDVGTLFLNDERDFLVFRAGSGTTVEIFDIAIGSERRVGKGRLLVNTLISKYLPKGTTLVWVITRSSNGIARDFYEALGFRVVGDLKCLYGRKGTDEEAVVDAIMYGKDVG